MATTLDTVAAPKSSAAAVAHRRLSARPSSVIAVVIAVLWTIPTGGLLLTSFRPEGDINKTGWWHVFTSPHLTLDNYRTALRSGADPDLAGSLLNSLLISIPAAAMPILLAAMAAYAFAWMRFPGRSLLFVMIFALQIVPIQVTLIPLLRLYVKLGLAGSEAPGGGFYTIWLSHTMFALPLAIYLMHNFMSEIPGELVESARIDGAGHAAIFARIILPLMTPAIAAFAILQFLWVWNDLLVALVFGGGSTDISPLTVELANLSGTRGSAWYLLSAGAFVSLIVPMAVFLALQRFFVRGLLAGSIKG